MVPREVEAELEMDVVGLLVPLAAMEPQEVPLQAPAAAAVAVLETQEVAMAATAALTAAAVLVQMHQARAIPVAPVERDI